MAAPIYGLARLAAQTGVSRTWYSTDALGSVRQTLSDSGAVLSAAQYDPWGVVEAGSAAPFGFTGELSDGGLVNLRARWYNPSAVTFVGRDPFAGFAETPYSLAPYQYGYADPVLYGDPSGRCVAESGGSQACYPDLQSTLRAYLQNPTSFEQRARADRGYEALNVVFDAYPDQARHYQVGQDSALRQYIEQQTPWLDAYATLIQLDFALQQWRLGDAQRTGQPIDLTPFTGAVGAMGLLTGGPDCFFGPLDGTGGGGIGGTRGRSRYNFDLLEEEGGIRIVVGSGPKGAIRFVSEESIEGDTLYMKGFHIEGPGAGSMGRTELNAFVQEYGQIRGVKRIVIQGGKRTTGKYIGQFPRPVIIEVP